MLNAEVIVVVRNGACTVVRATSWLVVNPETWDVVISANSEEVSTLISEVVRLARLVFEFIAIYFPFLS